MFHELKTEEIKMDNILNELVSAMYDYEPMIVSESVNEVIKRSLIETAFNIVVKNTSENTKLTANGLSYLREALTGFEKAEKISIEEYIDGGDLLNRKEYEYSTFMSKYNIKGWIEVTLGLISDISNKNIWFEDTLGNGFCCRVGNRHFRITYNA